MLAIGDFFANKTTIGQLSDNKIAMSMYDVSMGQYLMKSKGKF
jgi:hypothetical protein